MQCIFSGEDADTMEHVIPNWLQRRLNLAEQTLYIPNGTKLKYKNSKVPAKKEHNAKFGEIEDRISRGIFDPLEVYLWALKIHIGLIYRDSSLKMDIKDPNSPFILDIGDFDSECFLFRTLYSLWANGKNIDPAPFGSVYIFDSATKKTDFDLMHCLITGVVGIDIGDKFIFVILWDQSDTLSSNALEQWEKFHIPRLLGLRHSQEYEAQCYLAHHVWACEVAYFAYRSRRKFNLIATPNGITLIPPFTRLPPQDFDHDLFRLVCRNFALERVIKPEIGDYVYTQLEMPD